MTNPDKYEPCTPFEKVVINNLGQIKDKLHEQGQELANIKSDVREHHKEITSLKNKASMWGAVSGAITAFLLGLVGIK